MGTNSAKSDSSIKKRKLSHASETTLRVETIRDASRELVRELGLIGSLYGRILPTNTQCHVLIELDRRGALQPKELGLLLRIEKSTLSRVLAIMKRNEWILERQNAKDVRTKSVSLSAKGARELERVNSYVNQRVNNALLQLNDKDAKATVTGLALYAKALKRSRLLETTQIRPVSSADDPSLAALVRECLAEFGAGGSGAGFADSDPEIEQLSKAFSEQNRSYLVLESEGMVLGGGGIGPLIGGNPSICELQKMYFHPDLRGLGFGRKLIESLIQEAKRLNYQQMYLETLRRMEAANHLYKSVGFRCLDAPMGNTGHFGCDRWMVRSL